MAVWLMGALAFVCLGGGYALRGFVTSPDEVRADGEALPVGVISFAVERRTLTSSVVARADVELTGEVEVVPREVRDTDATVVTGAVPAVGESVDAGDVLLEVSGRPIFVLAGRFPAYRTLGGNSEGPDVVQLRHALGSLGFEAGSGQRYDSELATAVEALYESRGYPPPRPQSEEALDAVSDAEDALASAKTDFRLATASGSRDAIDLANRATIRAERNLEAAQQAALPSMPLAEVIFVSELPKRVEEVSLVLGQVLDAIPTAVSDLTEGVTLSGDGISAAATVTDAEAALLTEGGPAVLSRPNGLTASGRISAIHCSTKAVQSSNGEVEESEPGTQAAPSPAEDSNCRVEIGLDGMDADDRSGWIGNVQVTFVVGSSSEDSLVVPVAAVSGDFAGNAQVQVVDGELVKGVAAADQPTVTVRIAPGLSAEGFVEVVSATPDLREGDLVVLGVAAGAKDSE
jgi:hypothetical protein